MHRKKGTLILIFIFAVSLLLVTYISSAEQGEKRIKTFYLTNIEKWIDNLPATESEISPEVKDKTQEYLKKNEKSLFKSLLLDWVYLTPEIILAIHFAPEKPIEGAKLIKRVRPGEFEIITDLSVLNKILKIDAVKIIRDLDEKHRDIIPLVAIHGGTMYFSSIAVIAPKTFYVGYTDGHIGGGMLIREKSPNLWNVLYIFKDWRLARDSMIEERRREVARRPNSAEARYKLGESYRLYGMSNKAIEEFKKALELDPEFVSAQYGIADVCFFNLVDFPRARKEYQKIIDNFCSNTYIQWWRVTQTYLLMGDYQGAIEDYRRRAQKDPEEYGYIGLATGRIYDKLDKWSEARREYQKMVEYASTRPEEKIWRAEEAQWLIAECYRKEGKYELAIESYRKVIAGHFGTWDGRSLLRIGEIYTYLKNNKEALKAYREITRLYPQESKWAKEARKRIKILKSKRK